MKNFIDWFRQQKQTTTQPWLVVGKGPSFSKRHELDLTKFRIFSLNDVARELPVEVSHVIDMEVIFRSGAQLLANSTYLVMPWVPHERLKRGSRTLEEWSTQNDVVKAFAEGGRLLWYDLDTAPDVRGSVPPIHVDYFSSEAAVALLAMAGARTIKTLGIDGGISYSPEFKDIAADSCLANGHWNFDLQFKCFPHLIRKFGLEISSVDSQSPVPVFIGGSASEWLPATVLEYSIRKYASVSVQCFKLADCKIAIPEPRDESNRGRTPFSFQRFLIPQLTQHQGKAIYLDSDMLVFGDIRRLWESPLGANDLLCINANSASQMDSRFSVMLLNCAEIGWNINDVINGLNEGEYTYEQLMLEMVPVRSIGSSLPATWNCVDSYQPGVTELLHYTDMNRQPWLSCENPDAGLWVKHLREAIVDGVVTLAQLKAEIRKEYVRPSLLKQVEAELDDVIQLGEIALRSDLDFVPPHLRPTADSSSEVGIAAMAKSLISLFSPKKIKD